MNKLMSNPAWAEWPDPAKELYRSRLAWRATARPDQLPPDDGDWMWWLLEGGRGGGKTRAAAEWLTEQMTLNSGTYWAIIAATFGEGRDICVEGESGLLEVMPRGWVKNWNRSLGELVLINGSRARLFSAEKPGKLRGPNLHGGWWDEPAKCDHKREIIDTLRLALRLGKTPRMVASTTPRPSPVLTELRERATTRRVTFSTYANREHLSPAFIAEIEDLYKGTALERQEILGELLDEIDGALWRRDLFIYDTFDVPRRVVAVDPAVSSGEDSALTGIIVAGAGEHARSNGTVLEDLSMRAKPVVWAKAAADAYHRWGCTALVVENNQGHELLNQLFETVAPEIPIRTVWAKGSKKVRAEPVATLYEQGRISHARRFDELEDQMVSWIPGIGSSPDRVDATVHALTYLLIRPSRATATIGRPHVNAS